MLSWCCPDRSPSPARRRPWLAHEKRLEASTADRLLVRCGAAVRRRPRPDGVPHPASPVFRFFCKRYAEALPAGGSSSPWMEPCQHQMRATRIMALLDFAGEINGGDVARWRDCILSRCCWVNELHTATDVFCLWSLLVSIFSRNLYCDVSFASCG